MPPGLTASYAKSLIRAKERTIHSQQSFKRHFRYRQLFQQIEEKAARLKRGDEYIPETSNDGMIMPPPPSSRSSSSSSATAGLMYSTLKPNRRLYAKLETDLTNDLTEKERLLGGSSNKQAFQETMRQFRDTLRHKKERKKGYDMTNLIHRQIEYTRALMPLSGEPRDKYRPTLQAAAIFKDRTLPNKAKKIGGMRLKKLLLMHPLNEINHNARRSTRYRRAKGNVSARPLRGSFARVKQPQQHPSGSQTERNSASSFGFHSSSQYNLPELRSE